MALAELDFASSHCGFAVRPLLGFDPQVLRNPFSRIPFRGILKEFNFF